MHRIDSATVSQDLFGAGKDGFTEGVPATGTPPTDLTHYWFNDVQEELCNFIEGQGITLVKGTVTQLLAALRAPVGSGAGAAIAATGGVTNGTGLTGQGGGTTGKGVAGTGANHTTSTAGVGTSGSGGTATSGTGGIGVQGTGGTATSGTGGAGAVATGGATSAGTAAGGAGLTATGGASFGGTGGAGVSGTGGSPGGNGVTGQGTTSGKGVEGTGGATATTGVGVKGTGGAGGAIGVQGFGTSTSCGVEGSGASSPIATAATTGSGVVGRGGQTNGFGVEAFGKGNGAGVKGTGQTAAPGVSGVGGTSGAGVTGSGGATDGSIGVTGTSSATNGDGVHGTGTGTGIGVKGVGVTGYGVHAESDTSSPAKAALHVEPQNADPGTSPVGGDLYVHTPTMGLRGYDGQAWNRYVRMVNVETKVFLTDATPANGELLASIQAGSLVVGSMIRLAFQMRRTGGGTSLGFIIRFKDQDSQVLTIASSVAGTATDYITIEAYIGVVENPTDPAELAGYSTLRQGAVDTDLTVVRHHEISADTMDTTGDLEIYVDWVGAPGVSDTATVRVAMVEVT